MAEQNNSSVNLTDVVQYEQSSAMDSSEAITDGVTLMSNNTRLDAVQITNIGTGLLGNSPFSTTTGRTNNNVGFDRIDQSFRIILDTMLEEVPMLPILGSRLHGILFEPIDEITSDALQLVVEDALSKLEPRAVILSTIISDEYRDQNMISVQLEYRLTNTNITHIFRHSIVTGNGGDIL